MLIELVHEDEKVERKYSSKYMWKIGKRACKLGCIGCKLCENVCEAGGVTVSENIAQIDQTKCTGCGKCAEKCPKKIIRPV